MAPYKVKSKINVPNVVMMKVDELISYTRNAKLHPLRQVKKIAMSIEQYGFNIPVIIDSQNEIIAGHGRLLAAKLLKMDMVPCMRVDHLTPEQVRAFRIADNKVGESEWDMEQLQAEFQSLLSAEFDLSLTGFDNMEIDDLFKLEETEPEIKKSGFKVQTGDVFKIGEHRYMCGDSMKEEDVHTLLGETKIDIVLADPFYNMSGEKVMTAAGMMADRAIVLSGQKQAYDLKHCGFEFKLELVWHHRLPKSKSSPHMPILYHNNVVMMTRGETPLGWKRPHRKFSSIIESDGGGYVESSFGYAKEKRLFEEILRGFPFQTVGDPFAGLATTILACEGIGKTGYCMEIDPDICAMALDRLKSHGLIVTRLKDPV